MTAPQLFGWYSPSLALSQPGRVREVVQLITGNTVDATAVFSTVHARPLYPTDYMGLGPVRSAHVSLPSTVPTAPEHAASKEYVDALSAGLDPKESCRFATTGPIVLATNGLAAVDGTALIAGDRILVKDQGDPTENGIYIAQVGTWVRSADMDGTPANEISGGNYTFIEQGATLTGSGWVLIFDGEIDLGTDAIVWSQFSGGLPPPHTHDAADVTSGVFALARIPVASISHNSLADLTTGDPHTQYPLSAGRAGGQTIVGGTAVSEDLTLDSTAHATKGCINTTGFLRVNEQSGFGCQYEVSVQSGNSFTYMEILNDNGATGGFDQGVFFGIEGDQFSLYNWQGGDIIYYTDKGGSPTGGSINWTMHFAGDFEIHDGTLRLRNQATPAALPSGQGQVYRKSDDDLYYRSEGSAEKNLCTHAGDAISPATVAFGNTAPAASSLLLNYYQAATASLVRSAMTGTSVSVNITRVGNLVTAIIPIFTATKSGPGSLVALGTGAGAIPTWATPGSGAGDFVRVPLMVGENGAATVDTYRCRVNNLGGGLGGQFIFELESGAIIADLTALTLGGISTEVGAGSNFVIHWALP